jgi:hypothetical protein
MTVNFENDLGEDLHEHNGMFDLLADSGAGLLAGWAPSYRRGVSICLNEGGDNFAFNVEGEEDCRLFGRLLRIYVRILEERCAAFERNNGREVGHEDRAFDALALLRRDELPHLLSIAEFFERSKWVRRTG